MDRRELMKLGTGAMVAGLAPAIVGSRGYPHARPTQQEVEQWGLFETQANRATSTAIRLWMCSLARASTLGHRTVDVAGFYDGDGIYRVRFSPDSVGRWSFETTSNAKELAGLTGGFECVAPAAGQSRPGGHGASIPLSICRRDAVFPLRNDLLFLRIYWSAISATRRSRT